MSVNRKYNMRWIQNSAFQELIIEEDGKRPAFLATLWWEDDLDTWAVDILADIEPWLDVELLNDLVGESETSDEAKAAIEKWFQKAIKVRGLLH